MRISGRKKESEEEETREDARDTLKYGSLAVLPLSQFYPVKLESQLELQNKSQPDFLFLSLLNLRPVRLGHSFRGVSCMSALLLFCISFRGAIFLRSFYPPIFHCKVKVASRSSRPNGTNGEAQSARKQVQPGPTKYRTGRRREYRVHLMVGRAKEKREERREHTHEHILHGLFDAICSNVRMHHCIPGYPILGPFIRAVSFDARYYIDWRLI